MFHQIRDCQFSIHRPGVTDRMNLIVLEEDLSCRDGPFPAVFVEEIDTAGNNRAGQDPGMSVPAALPSRRKHELLDVEVRGALRL